MRNKIKKQKIAFTLAEILVAVMVLGVVVAICLPSFMKAIPDKSKTMFKKAYSVTERTIGELINDDSFYPYNPNAYGFRNTSNVIIPGTNTQIGGNTKLCDAFASKLNLISQPKRKSGNCIFETTDGIIWTIPDGVSEFNANPPTAKVIMIDTNGDKEPNTATGTDKKRDRFNINIYYDGKVNVTGTQELKFLRSHSTNQEEK